jgi:hypothetical protein
VEDDASLFLLPSLGKGGRHGEAMPEGLCGKTHKFTGTLGELKTLCRNNPPVTLFA